ncbi:MAG: phosphatidylglycerophosphatase A [Planctomycetota bacterium]
MGNKFPWRRILLSGLGTGYLPLAPGTWASAAAAAVALGVEHWLPTPVAILVLMLSSLGALTGGVWLGQWAEQHYGEKDPPTVVVDEFAGQWLVCLLFGWRPESLLAATGIAFLTFRIFDVIKPPPARRLEHLNYGWGVMLDDLVAGIYAATSCWVIYLLWPAPFT